MGRVVQEGGLEWGLGGAVPEVQGGYTRTFRTEMMSLFPPFSPQLPWQLNAKSVLDIIVAGNGGHVGIIMSMQD